MIMEDLSAAGLNATEAKCYKALLSQKQWLPSALANSVGETRTNVYKVLDNLCALGLAERLDMTKKLQYRAVNPSRLLQLARELRIKREEAEKALETRTESLMRQYIDVHEQAAVRFYQGQSAMGQIFQEIAASKEEVVFIHTKAGQDFYGFAAMHNLRILAPNAGVSRRGLTPDTEAATADYASSDPQVLLKRTWLKADDYDAPVEWGAFDDKLYIISYGTEAMGMVVESKQIAGAFKQLFRLLERGQHLLPDYDELPRLARKKGVTAPKL
jgi:sugar-specific transcriptional regulator TrmB